LTIKKNRRLLEIKIQNQNFIDLGGNRVFFGFFSADVGFWAKNGGWFVKICGLGKIGKKKALKNEQKCEKKLEKMEKNGKESAKIRKNAYFWDRSFRHEDSKRI